MYTDKKHELQTSNTTTENSSILSSQQENNEIKSLKNLRYLQKRYKEKYESDLPEKSSSYKKMLKKLFSKLIEKNDFCCRCSPHVAPLILQDHLKNQLETGTSGGSLNLENRRMVSTILFGTDYGNTEDSDYEKYGYLGSQDDEQKLNDPLDQTDQYGEIILVLKKSNLKDRTTFTIGDSLDSLCDGHILPSLVTKPKAFSVPLLKVRKEESEDEYYDEYEYYNDYQCATKDPERINKVLQKESLLVDVPAVLEILFPDSGYFELQYHGSVTAKDIDRILLDSDEVSDEEIDEIEAQAEEKSVAIKVI